MEGAGLQRPRRLEGVPGPRVILWGKGDEGPGVGAGHTREPTFSGGQLAPPGPQFLRPPCSHPALLLIPSPFPCSSCILVHLCSAPLANKHLPRPGQGQGGVLQGHPPQPPPIARPKPESRRGEGPGDGSLVEVATSQVCLMLNHWLFWGMVLRGCPAPNVTERRLCRQRSPVSC